MATPDLKRQRDVILKVDDVIRMSLKLNIWITKLLFNRDFLKLHYFLKLQNKESEDVISEKTTHLLLDYIYI